MPNARSLLDQHSGPASKDGTARFAEIQRQQGKTISRKQMAMTSRSQSENGSSSAQRIVEGERGGA